jgi:hypothetical protein
MAQPASNIAARIAASAVLIVLSVRMSSFPKGKVWGGM